MSWQAWKRHRGVGMILWIALLLVVLSGLGLGTLYQVVDRWEMATAIGELMTLPARSPAEVSPGAPVPGVFHGRLRTTGKRIAPLGGPSATWAGSVTRTYRSGKSNRTDTLCSFIYMSQLRLEGSSKTVTLGATTTTKAVYSATDDLPPWRPGTIAMDLGPEVTRKGLPTNFDVNQECGRLAYSVGLDYHEMSIADGAEVDVTGCLDAGKQEIVGCNEAPLTVSVRRRRSIAAAWRNHALSGMAWPIAIALFVGTLAWLGAAQASIRVARKDAPAAI